MRREPSRPYCRSGTRIPKTSARNFSICTHTRTHARTHALTHTHTHTHTHTAPGARLPQMSVRRLAGAGGAGPRLRATHARARARARRHTHTHVGAHAKSAFRPLRPLLLRPAHGGPVRDRGGEGEVDDPRERERSPEYPARRPAPRLAQCRVCGATEGNDARRAPPRVSGSAAASRARPPPPPRRRHRPRTAAARAHQRAADTPPASPDCGAREMRCPLASQAGCTLHSVPVPLRRRYTRRVRATATSGRNQKKP